MAKKDVNLYFLQVQSQYVEMLDNLKELAPLLRAGKIDQERFDEARQEIETIKGNYERLAYIMLLLNKPNRKTKKSKEEFENKEWYDALSGASKEAIIDENKDILADFKKMIKECKENDNKDSIQ